MKPAVAGLVVGAIGLAVPGVLGTGYGQIQTELDPHQLLPCPCCIVLRHAARQDRWPRACRSVRAARAASSGRAWSSAAPPVPRCGGCCTSLGSAQHDQAAFVIVGMMACFGPIAHAPLAVMVMVAEMTGNLSLYPPAMVAIVLAVIVVGDTTIYRSQPANRGASRGPT